ncbi:MAG: tRNA (guanosine(46)-N7)-methyltransferase TrmB [Clostridia bacterium]|nr:tRNA (guanosine(46)-N7)-methyltransferase TrmB [Clostridia bacterium]
MHMRTKKWARPELHACPYYAAFPEEMKGTWHTRFTRPGPVHLELGCGKGVGTAQMVHDHPEINFLAMDISDDVLGDARRNIERALEGEDGRQADNIYLVKCDIEFISKILGPEDVVDRIHIYFCNPWSKQPHKKRRLTHPRQLCQYRTFLRDGGEIYFKTDDKNLWEESLRYFKTCLFDPVFLTEDLHGSGFSPNYMTEHERKFAAQGLPIYFGIFRKLPGEVQLDPTRFYLGLSDRVCDDNS